MELRDLLEVLLKIAWPRETQVSVGIQKEGPTVWLDVDLPELEDMPTHSATVATRGLRVNIKPRSEVQRHKEYLVDIHGVAFRLIGETPVLGGARGRSYAPVFRFTTPVFIDSLQCLRLT